MNTEKKAVPKTTPRARMSEERFNELWGSCFNVATTETQLRENMCVLASELEEERAERDLAELALRTEIAARMPTEFEFQALQARAEAAESALLKAQMELLEMNEGMLLLKEQCEELQNKLDAINAERAHGAAMREED